MEEYDKNRIVFSIALFTASFTLYPILKDIKAVIHLNYEPFVKPLYFFWFFNLCLGLAIYLYAVSFIGEDVSLVKTKVIADYIYKGTIMLPILYFLFYFFSFLIHYYYAHQLEWLDFGGFSLITEDNYFNFLQLTALIISVIMAAVVGFDILNNYEKHRDRTKNE